MYKWPPKTQKNGEKQETFTHDIIPLFQSFLSRQGTCLYFINDDTIGKRTTKAENKILRYILSFLTKQNTDLQIILVCKNRRGNTSVPKFIF